MIKIGVVGYGYWGPLIVRNFNHAANAQVTMIAEIDAERRSLAATDYPGIRVTDDFRELLADAATDLVAVATPLSSHFDLAFAALEAGRHVLVEKPLAASVTEALRLIEAAERASRILMVDHTFLFSPPVQKIHELVTSGELGEIYYFDSVRVNLGLFRHDTNVIWDLAVHDLSIMNHVLPHSPVAVSATGTGHISDQGENTAYLTMFFGNDSTIAHVHVNWLAPVKVRRTLLGGSRKMVVYDDLEPSEKIKVYDRGVDVADDPDRVSEILLSYRVGDLWAPNLPIREPLQNVVRHMLDCVETGATPLTDGLAGLRVVRVIEAATSSMRMRGAPVEIARD